MLPMTLSSEVQATLRYSILRPARVCSLHSESRAGAVVCIKHELTASRFFEIALVIQCLDNVARRIVNANHDGMRPAVRPCVVNCIHDCLWPAVPQRTVSKRVAAQIKTVPISSGSNFVNVYGGSRMLTFA